MSERVDRKKKVWNGSSWVLENANYIPLLDVDSNGDLAIGGSGQTGALNVRGETWLEGSASTPAFRILSTTTANYIQASNAARNAAGTLHLGGWYGPGIVQIAADGLITGTGTSLGAWTSYTPTVEQSTSGNLTKTVTYAKYVRIGKIVRVVVYVALTQTATGKGGNNILIGLPSGLGATTTGIHIGLGQYASAGTYYPCLVNVNTDTSKVQLVRTDSTTTNNAGMGANPWFDATSGDLIRFEATYEIA